MIKMLIKRPNLALKSHKIDFWYQDTLKTLEAHEEEIRPIKWKSQRIQKTE